MEIQRIQNCMNIDLPFQYLMDICSIQKFVSNTFSSRQYWKNSDHVFYKVFIRGIKYGCNQG